MKVISFLGIGNYEVTKYQFDNSNFIEAQYFPYAANQYFKPDDHYILMTSEAKEKHYEALIRLFKFHNVEIPIGKSEDQFWEIFDDIVACVNDGDEIILDITYGFRSQPVLALSALIYLSAVRKVKIIKVIYGAFDAKKDDVVPVFDLKSFIELIEWSYATRDFIEYAKAGQMNRLMSEIQNSSFFNNESIKAKGLKTSGKTLESLTRSMALACTKKIFENGLEFINNSEKLIKDLNEIQRTKPLSLLIDKISNRVEPMTVTDIFSKTGLEAQLITMRWMIDTEQYQQAITLMNEFYITLECIKMNNDPLKIVCRKKASEALGEKIKLFKDMTINENDKDKIVLWNRLSEVRNEINHGGLKPEVTNVETQIKNIIELYERLTDYYNNQEI